MTEKVTTGGDSTGKPPVEPPTPPESQSVEPPGDPEGQPKTYDEDYVKKLRDEAAEKRKKAKESEDRANNLAAKLMDTTLQAICKDLADPEDLLAWNTVESLLDDDGLPDEQKILQAQAALLEKKPHLRSRGARGDIEQGPRGIEQESFSFNDWLKGAAS